MGSSSRKMGYSQGSAAPRVGASAWTPEKVPGSIPGQGTYKNQPVSKWNDKSLSLSPSVQSMKKNLKNKNLENTLASGSYDTKSAAPAPQPCLRPWMCSYNFQAGCVEQGS